LKKKSDSQGNAMIADKAASERHKTIIPARGFEITNNQMKIKPFGDIWSDHPPWQDSEPDNRYGALPSRLINV